VLSRLNSYTLTKKIKKNLRNVLSTSFPAMEVSEIILAEVSRLCQLSSYNCGFLSRLQIFKSIGPSLWISLVHKTTFYDTKMLLKVVFDKNSLCKI
jgi:hypothetical protein